MTEKRTAKYFGLRPGHSVRNEHSHVCVCHPDEEPHISIPAHLTQSISLLSYIYEHLKDAVMAEFALFLVEPSHLAPLYGTFALVSFQGNGMQSYTGHDNIN